MSLITLFQLPATLVALCASSATASVRWISSTESAPWQEVPAPRLVEDDRPPEIRIDPAKAYQTIEGFGGCFNELSWIALNRLPSTERDRALHALFDPDKANFNLARIPIGASDFATDAYSLDDTPGDLELNHFSIERDRKHLLPFIHAAMKLRPDLRCWASPWSPPAWMKTNNHYSGGSIRSEPDIYRAYATYFSRWIDEYKAEGVKVYAVTPQNEPNITNKYPTCDWSAGQLRTFIVDHLGPTLRKDHADVELWLGLNGDPPSDGHNANARLIPILEDVKASSFLAGIAFQYDSQNQTALARELYPDKKLMQSETVCFNGDNSWDQAIELYRLMRRYLAGGAGSYFMWNFVLDEKSMSTWDWKQNALMTADVGTQQIRFNGEYHVVRHFSQFVKPGAKRIRTTGPWNDQIAFANPDGSIVLVLANSSDRPHDAEIEIARRAESITVSVPARSVHTFVFDQQ